MSEPPPTEPVAPAPELIPTRHWMRARRPPPVDKSSGGWFWRTLLWLFLLSLVPPGIVVALRWLPPPTTAYMLQSPTKPVQYQWVPATQIAEHARRAVVAAEDQKFREHQGFDLEAIQKALEHNQRSKKVRGGSTISQQTAKNLFLWPGGGYFRKGIEATFTVLLEYLWGKDRILEVYLNIAEFGPGIYGVEAAARNFFGKNAAQLTPAEAARLAAVLPSPRRWSAKKPGPYVQKRQNWILGQMGFGQRREEPEPPPGSFEPVTAPQPLGIEDAEPLWDSGPPPEPLPEPVEDMNSLGGSWEDEPAAIEGEAATEPAPAEEPALTQGENPSGPHHRP